MPSDVKRILCVDDNEDACFMLRALFGQEGVDAIAVQTVDEALKLMNDHDFDLYLLDTQLPGTSGIDLCTVIRAIDYKTPIVFYSASSHPEDRRRAMQCGATAYVLKPNIENLVEAVAELLDISSSQSSLDHSR
jgi:CheY-like chemotaxis protein